MSKRTESLGKPTVPILWAWYLLFKAYTRSVAFFMLLVVLGHPIEADIMWLDECSEDESVLETNSRVCSLSDA